MERDIYSAGIITLMALCIQLVGISGFSDIISENEKEYAFHGKIIEVSGNGNEFKTDLGDASGIGLGMEGNIVRTKPKEERPAKVVVKRVDASSSMVVRGIGYAGGAVITGDHVFLGKEKGDFQRKKRIDIQKLINEGRFDDVQDKVDEYTVSYGEDANSSEFKNALQRHAADQKRIQDEREAAEAEKKHAQEELDAAAARAAKAEAEKKHAQEELDAAATRAAMAEAEKKRAQEELAEASTKGTLKVIVNVPNNALGYYSAADKRISIDDLWESFYLNMPSRSGLKVGRHKIGFNATGFTGGDAQWVDIKRMETTAVVFELIPLDARLRINCSALGAYVSITALNMNLPVNETVAIRPFAGFRIEISAPGYVTEERYIKPLYPDKTEQLWILLHPVKSKKTRTKIIAS
jgi:hypothetical protein